MTDRQTASKTDGFCTCGGPQGDPRESRTCGIARHRAAYKPLSRWRQKRLERLVIRLERRLRNLDNHASWETSFDRWGPAQERAYRRERAEIVRRYDEVCDRLGVSSGDNC